MGAFITKAPVHPLTIAGYLLGALAVFAGVVQIANLKVPFLSEPRNALVTVAAIIVIKIVIARFRGILG